MLKVVENCRPAVPFARVLLICSLFAIGFASTARADEYQHTITFDPSSQSGLSMSATFLAGMLPGGLGTIDPASVQIPKCSSLGSLRCQHRRYSDECAIGN